MKHGLEIKIVECETLGTNWVDIHVEGRPFACQVVREAAERFLGDLDSDDSLKCHKAEDLFIQMSNFHASPSIACGWMLSRLMGEI